MSKLFINSFGGGEDVCPMCGSDPCACEDENVCPMCGNNPCTCGEDEM